ncbi:MAG TPA: DnaA regulatory inactivator Hda [Steroidobacteraceae bacterium]|nr:DnaA regulatory inactivator Hda [Steroidobacteraceae bacterium]
MRQLALGVTLRANAVFENFSAGPNVELLAALRSPATDPLWLWGSRGCGKTHLLQAACAAAGGPAAYIGIAARAAPEIPGAAPEALPPEALQGLADCRVVCVDDTAAAAGDLDWEQALFRLFNEAQESGARLLFAADRAPRQIDWRLDDWRSRAAACVVYQVRELDEAGRGEALRLRAEQRGLDLPQETLEYLMKRLPRDLRSLFEILDELDEASLAAQRRLTIPFIREALEKHAGTGSWSRTTRTPGAG